MRRTMEPYFMTEFEKARPDRAERQDNVGRNRELPPRLAALQPEPAGTPSARRPRAGRYRHHAVGHPAHRLGERRARKLLNPRERPPLQALAFPHRQTTGKKMIFLSIFWTTFIPFVMVILTLLGRVVMSTLRNLRSEARPLQALVGANEPTGRQKSA